MDIIETNKRTAERAAKLGFKEEEPFLAMSWSLIMRVFGRVLQEHYIFPEAVPEDIFGGICLACAEALGDEETYEPMIEEVIRRYLPPELEATGTIRANMEACYYLGAPCVEDPRAGRVWLLKRVLPGSEHYTYSLQAADRWNRLYAKKTPVIQAQIRDVLAELKGTQARFHERIERQAEKRKEKSKGTSLDSIWMMIDTDRPGKDLMAQYSDKKWWKREG